MPTKRREALLNLIELRSPVSDAAEQVRELPWDGDEDGTTLSADHCLRLLRAFDSGELDRSDVESWANALESREDVGYEPEFEGEIKQILHELANPDLGYALTAERSSELQQAIQR